MSLDLSKVAGQIIGMVARLKQDNNQMRERLDLAIKTFQNVDFVKLKNKLDNSRTTWLLAGLIDNLTDSINEPLCPNDFTILASDGSHIDVDRHQAARCFLINIGLVTLNYGKNPDARLENFPRLYSGDREMVISNNSTGEREQVIDGTLLGIKRSVEECAYLADVAERLPSGSKVVALLDGSLILWGLVNRDYPDFVVESFLERGILLQLDRIRKLNESIKFALASYISFPRSNDVVNILRVAICPHDEVDTDRICSSCSSRDCDKLSGVLDRNLFESILQTGDRSSVFSSSSSIVKQYGSHHVNFFYLKSEDEIARVEIPEWVAKSPELLDLTHSLVLDQCRRGQGYPVALSEAHQQAVITAGDRENFWQFVESTLVAERLPITGSLKNKSKKTRWI